MSTILSMTLCRLDLHCGKRVRKWDGGQRSALCRHCRKITGHWS